jgi:hypothetical protein
MALSGPVPSGQVPRPGGYSLWCLARPGESSGRPAAPAAGPAAGVHTGERAAAAQLQIRHATTEVHRDVCDLIGELAAQGRRPSWRTGMALGAAGTGLLTPITPEWRHAHHLQCSPPATARHGVSAPRKISATRRKPARSQQTWQRALKNSGTQDTLTTCNSETWRKRPSQEQRNTAHACAHVTHMATGAEKQRNPGQVSYGRTQQRSAACTTWQRQAMGQALRQA